MYILLCICYNIYKEHSVYIVTLTLLNNKNNPFIFHIFDNLLSDLHVKIKFNPYLRFMEHRLYFLEKMRPSHTLLV